MTKRPPLIFRLMLCSLFLPIFILGGISISMIPNQAPEEIWGNHATMFGVSMLWYMFAIVAFPFVLWFWMFWSGNWRRPVLTAAIVYCVIPLLAAMNEIGEWGMFEIRTPPDKRMIHLGGIAGTDVYCNDVHLGQLPLNIRVDELVEKVPQWDTPPEQRWYDDSDLEKRLTTWFPWDNFRKERFESSKEIFTTTSSSKNANSTPRVIAARRAALLAHDAECRYWWSYKFGKAQMAFYRERDSSGLYGDFDSQSSYHSNIPSPFSPSLGFHAQLLADVLPELTPEQKQDWDRYVLTQWSLLAGPLQQALSQMAQRHRWDKNESLAEVYETALHSTARVKYNLSNPPTEAECRRLLAEWVKEGTFQFDYVYSYYERLGRAPSLDENVLIPPDIHETMRSALVEQWRKNKYRFESGFAPVVYFSAMDKSPDYFSDFARYSATTHNAMLAMLENEAPETVPLFRTLLHRRSITEALTPQIQLYSEQIDAFSQVNNPLVEAEFREFVLKALADPKHTESSRNRTERAVVRAMFGRVYRGNLDQDDLAAWIASLPIAAAPKSLALRTLRLRGVKDELTFADRLQQAAGINVLIETELTLDDIVAWFTENPAGMLVQFLEEQEDNIAVNIVSESRSSRWSSYSDDSFNVPEEYHELIGKDGTGNLPQWFVLAILRSDTSEEGGDPRVRELIRQLWLRNYSILESAFLSEYGTVRFQRNDSKPSAGSNYFPEHFLDLYLSSEGAFWEEVMNMSGGRLVLMQTLTFCESSKAGAILEKWRDEESNTARQRELDRSLEIWRTRNAMRQIKMEVVQDLIAGRMTPDDLLLPQPPWVWKNGEYVQQ